MALSRKFIWVKVNRDRTPDIPKRFGVSAYPTLLTLGDKQEKVHRFQGYKKPEEFREQLTAALERWNLYRAGREWDTPEARPASISDAGTVESFGAPSEAVPSGLAFLGDTLWVAQQGVLFELDRKGAVVTRHEIPKAIRDLCTDGKHLYGMEYGWTAGKPIHVMDPATGKVMRTIITKANAKNRAMGAAGIAWHGDKLYVLAGMRGIISELDPATGAVTRTIQTDARWLSCLDHDGKHFVAGSRTDLRFIDPASGKTVRTVKVNYPLRAVAHHRGAYHLMEQPVFGHDKQHKRVQVWPKRTAIYKLTLK